MYKEETLDLIVDLDCQMFLLVDYFGKIKIHRIDIVFLGGKMGTILGSLRSESPHFLISPFSIPFPFSEVTTVDLLYVCHLLTRVVFLHRRGRFVVR